MTKVGTSDRRTTKTTRLVKRHRGSASGRTRLSEEQFQRLMIDTFESISDCKSANKVCSLQCLHDKQATGLHIHVSNTLEMIECCDLMEFMIANKSPLCRQYMSFMHKMVKLSNKMSNEVIKNQERYGPRVGASVNHVITMNNRMDKQLHKLAKYISA